MDKIYRIEETTELETAPSLKYIIEEHSELVANLWDHFAFLFHALMLESGFKIRSNVSKKPNYYVFHYDLAAQEKVSTYCSLTVNKIGPINKIIGNFHGVEDTESYILTKNYKITDVIESNGFKNLRVISIEFKDKIALPLLVKMQDVHGIVPKNILQCPDEILVKIAERLSDAETIKNFTETCQRFWQIQNHPLLWKTLLRKHFPEKYKVAIAEGNRNQDWKELFKEAQMEVTNKRSRIEQEEQRISSLLNIEMVPGSAGIPPRNPRIFPTDPFVLDPIFYWRERWMDLFDI